MYIWRQCNKDPSAALGMTVLGERMVSRGGGIAAFLEEGILVSTTQSLATNPYYQSPVTLTTGCDISNIVGWVFSIYAIMRKNP